MVVAELEAEEEEEEEEENAASCERLGESFTQTSLSSSLMVSKTLDVLCLMTLTNCGGATSVMNLAMREFAIVRASKNGKRRKIWMKNEQRSSKGRWGFVDFGCG